jgi:hypothetical protein
VSQGLRFVQYNHLSKRRLSDPLVTPVMFAHTICEDFDLPTIPFQTRIAEAIVERVRESEVAVLPTTMSTDLSDTLSEEDLNWWKRMRDASYEVDDEEDHDLKPLSIQDLIPGNADDLPFDLRIRVQVSLHCRACKVNGRSNVSGRIVLVGYHFGRHAPVGLLRVGPPIRNYA